jgi:hypothetical protein
MEELFGDVYPAAFAKRSERQMASRQPMSARLVKA